MKNMKNFSFYTVWLDIDSSCKPMTR